MLRSKYCQLEEQSEQDLTTLGECPLDQASMQQNYPLACPHVSWAACIQPCMRAALVQGSAQRRLVQYGHLQGVSPAARQACRPSSDGGLSRIRHRAQSIAPLSALLSAAEASSSGAVADACRLACRVGTSS